MVVAADLPLEDDTSVLAGLAFALAVSVVTGPPGDVARRTGIRTAAALRRSPAADLLPA